MKVVYKYPIDIHKGVHAIQHSLPVSSRVVAVQVQHGVPCVWIERERMSDAVTTRTYGLFGTGADIEPGGRHVGTVQLNSGDLVLHVYEFGV